MEEIRLSKALAKAGIASRRKCEEIIFAKRVCVNGKLVTTPQTLVSLIKDKITIDNEQIASEQKKVYYLFHKPVGYLSSHEDKKKTIYHFFPKKLRLFSAGRLDKETSGLMIITNDGQLSNRASHPSYNHIKEYLVKVTEEVTSEHLQTLINGVFIDGNLIKPKSVKKMRKGTIKIAISEGKKHEIRLLVQKADLNLKELIRIRIGPLHLGSLPVGQHREMSLAEKSIFF